MLNYQRVLNFPLFDPNPAGQYELLSTQHGTCSKGSRATSPHAVPGNGVDHQGKCVDGD